MTEKMIRDAYCRIRAIDQTIPDDVLDFMKDAAIEKLNSMDSGGIRLIGMGSPIKAVSHHLNLSGKTVVVVNDAKVLDALIKNPEIRNQTIVIEDVEAFVDKSNKPNPFDIPPMTLTNHREYENFSDGKQFVCKGKKHEYREVGGEWVCQCGKKLEK